MSAFLCYDCGRLADAKDGESEVIEIGNMKRQHKEVFVCGPCYEARMEELEHQNYFEHKGEPNEQV